MPGICARSWTGGAVGHLQGDGRGYRAAQHRQGCSQGGAQLRAQLLQWLKALGLERDGDFGWEWPCWNKPWSESSREKGGGWVQHSRTGSGGGMKECRASTRSIPHPTHREAAQRCLPPFSPLLIPSAPRRASGAALSRAGGLRILQALQQRSPGLKATLLQCSDVEKASRAWRRGRGSRRGDCKSRFRSQTAARGEIYGLSLEAVLLLDGT